MPDKKYSYQNLSLKDMKAEQWEDIPGLDGMYRISNFGRIKRMSFELLCKDGTVKKLYPRVLNIEVVTRKNKSVNDSLYFLRSSIMVNGRAYKISIARTVYYCFVRKFKLDDPFLVVYAKNGDGRIIRPSNLALVSISRKQQRIFERGRLKRTITTSLQEFKQFGKIKSANPYCRQISQYTMLGKKLQTYPSIKAASQITGVSEKGIVAVLKCRQISSGEYVWAYGRKSKVDVVAIRKKNLERRNVLVGQKVTQYNLKGKRIAFYPTVSEAGRKIGIRSSDISTVINGKQKTAAGFIWRKGVGRNYISVKGFTKS
jgi:hypothetical protein